MHRDTEIVHAGFRRRSEPGPFLQGPQFSSTYTSPGDPGDNPLTYGYLLDLFEALAPARTGLGSIACPVLVIAGDRDPAASMGANATQLTAALRAAGVDAGLTLYPGARHELLNETNRDEVTADVVAWLRRVM